MTQPLATVDVLAIGAHPDDVEFGMGGTLVHLAKKGYRIGVIDLTRGENGSKGTPERRREEALQASQVYQALFRICLDIGDGHVVDEPSHAKTIAQYIRMVKPKLIFTHDGDDRHPDHRGAHELINRAVFYASLRSLDLGYAYHIPYRVIYFVINEIKKGDFYVDITNVWEEKLTALKAFASQFVEPVASIDRIYFGVEDYLKTIDARGRVYGQAIGATYAEPFKIADGLAIEDPVQTFLRTTGHLGPA